MKETIWWTLQLLAGLLLLLLMALHMGLMHLNDVLGVADPTQWGSVVARARQITYLALYILVLGAALFHGFYGLRNILYELSMPKAIEKMVSFLVFVVGAVLFLYGAYTVYVTYGA